MGGVRLQLQGGATRVDGVAALFDLSQEAFTGLFQATQVVKQVAGGGNTVYISLQDAAHHCHLYYKIS